MEFLNNYSGLFSLLAVVTSVVAIVVSVVIYRKQKKEQQQDLLDELEIMKRPRHPLEMNKEIRERNEKMELLEKKLRRRK